jgi:hypothetical protein
MASDSIRFDPRRDNMARNSTNDRNDTKVRNLDHATQNRELTEAELDAVSGGSLKPTTPTTVVVSLGTNYLD